MQTFMTPVVRRPRFRGRRTWAAQIQGAVLSVSRRCFEVAIDKQGDEVSRAEVSRLPPIELGDGLIAYSGDAFAVLTVIRIVDGWGKCEVTPCELRGACFVLPATGLRTPNRRISRTEIR